MIENEILFICYIFMKDIIEICFQTIYQHLHLSYHNDVFIDFTAGRGLFINDMNYLVSRGLFFDNAISDRSHPNIVAHDFLDPAFCFTKFEKTYFYFILL